MSNVHRVRWIDQQVRSQLYPNCRAVADEFNISIRQVARDIDFMKHNLEAPLRYSYKNNGYYYCRDFFLLPSLFRPEEALLEESSHRGLIFQKKMIRHLKFIEILLQCFLGSTLETQVTKWPLSTVPAKPFYARMYYQIDLAMKTRKKMDLKLSPEGSHHQRMIVHPYLWIYSFKYPYLIAFSEQIKDLVIFRIDKIKKILPLKQTYAKDPDFCVESIVNPSSIRSLLPYHALIKWDDVMHFPDHFEYPVRALENHIYEIQFHHSSSLIASLISLQSPFVILAPQWLSDRYQQFLQLYQERAAKKYD